MNVYARVRARANACACVRVRVGHQRRKKRPRSLAVGEDLSSHHASIKHLGSRRPGRITAPSSSSRRYCRRPSLTLCYGPGVGRGVGRRHPGGCKPTPLRTRRHLRRSPSVSRDRVGLNESNDRRVPFRLAGMTSVLDPSLVGALFYGRLARNGARDDSRLQLVARAIRF